MFGREVHVGDGLAKFLPVEVWWRGLGWWTPWAQRPCVVLVGRGQWDVGVRLVQRSFYSAEDSLRLLWVVVRRWRVPAG